MVDLNQLHSVLLGVCCDAHLDTDMDMQAECLPYGAMQVEQRGIHEVQLILHVVQIDSCTISPERGC